ncbi:MAG TPA: hypothetical protein VH643_36435 [Gemmataceae bacterium]|jgi:hypothetical protein
MKVGTKYATSGLVALATLLLSLSVGNAEDKGNKVTTVPAPDRGQPVVARTDTEGTIHLLYDTADGPQYVKSLDKGKTFCAAIPVVDKGSRKPGLEFHGSDMVVGQGGRIHVAMSTNAWKLKLPEKQWGFYYARIEPGAKTFSQVRNINNKPSEGFSLAADEKGNVTACWLSDKLFANVSHDNGKTFGPNVEINPAYDPCNCCTTSAAYGTDGKLAILYREETKNERDMYLVLWDQARSQTSRTRISTTLWKIDACPMTYYTVSRAAGGFVAVWPTGNKYDIYFARLDQKGNLLPPGEIKTPGKAGHRTGMTALSAPDGSTLVTWSTDNQLGWQLYDTKGQPSGPAGSAKSSGNGVAGVVDKAGRFILFR